MAFVIAAEGAAISALQNYLARRVGRHHTLDSEVQTYQVVTQTVDWERNARQTYQSTLDIDIIPRCAGVFKTTGQTSVTRNVLKLVFTTHTDRSHKGVTRLLSDSQVPDSRTGFSKRINRDVI